jgi:hypothetical protein
VSVGLASTLGGPVFSGFDTRLGVGVGLDPSRHLERTEPSRADSHRSTHESTSLGSALVLPPPPALSIVAL